MLKRLGKHILRILPLKRQLFTVVRYFSPPEWVFRHLYFSDWFTVAIEQRSFLMYHYGHQLENQVFWKGLDGWEGASMRLWVALSARSRIIIDVGANTGLFSLVAKTVNPDAEIYAFEPVERVYRKLRRNIEANRFDIVAERLGVSNFTGAGMIYDIPEDHVYSVTINKNLNPTDRMVIPTTISVTTLDEYVHSHKLGPVELLKIDVETHEPEVLEGARNLIRESRPSMLVEVLTQEAATRIAGILKDLNYAFFSIDELRGPRLTMAITPNLNQNYLLYAGNPQDVINLWNEEATH